MWSIDVYRVEMLSASCHHESLIIMLILSGCAVVRVANRTYQAETEDIIFVNPGEVYEIKADQKDTDMLIFEMNVTSGALLPTSYDFKNCLLINHPFDVNAKTYTESKYKYFGRNLYVHLLSLFRNKHDQASFELLLRILQTHYSVSRFSELNEKCLNEHQRKRIDNILRLIRENYEDKNIFDRVIASENLTKVYLSQIFKEHLNISFTEYTNYQRIILSESELIFSNASIVDIAYAYGFSDTKYYYKTFKKIYKNNPGAWRKKYLDQKSAQIIRYGAQDAALKLDAFSNRYLQGVAIKTDFISKYEHLQQLFAQAAPTKVFLGKVNIDLLKENNLGNSLQPFPLWSSMGPLIDLCLQHELSIEVCLDMNYKGSDQDLQDIVTKFIDINIKMRGKKTVQNWNYNLVTKDSRQIDRARMVHGILQNYEVRGSLIHWIF